MQEERLANFFIKSIQRGNPCFGVRGCNGAPTENNYVRS
nr:MAG TPA: hypothetical protein [Caudoviricetes sp.]